MAKFAEIKFRSLTDRITSESFTGVNVDTYYITTPTPSSMKKSGLWVVRPNGIKVKRNFSNKNAKPLDFSIAEMLDEGIVTKIGIRMQEFLKSINEKGLDKEFTSIEIVPSTEEEEGGTEEDGE